MWIGNYGNMDNFKDRAKSGCGVESLPWTGLCFYDHSSSSTSYCDQGSSSRRRFAYSDVATVSTRILG